jgi:predicted adenylyl cyclase CyaB
MKEIEILYKCNDHINHIQKCLNKFNFCGSKKTIDWYFYDPLRENFKPKDGKLYECFRLREKSNSYYMTYKFDNYENGEWIYSDEEEIEIDNINVAKNIIKNLGLKELVKIDNMKHTYIVEDYEIVLEDVDGLGIFIEIELKLSDQIIDEKREKEKIRNFVRKLGIDIGEELNSGKPELMLQSRDAEQIGI